MDEILAKFPEDMPTLINFYDAKTEADIKGDIVRAKGLLKDRCTVVSVKQQDYPGKKALTTNGVHRFVIHYIVCNIYQGMFLSLTAIH